jgi:hypothetical protein
MAAADPTKLLKPETTKLLEPENWPTPKWYAEGKALRIQTYEEYFTFQLRARYSELENDFRSVLGNFPNIADVVTATRISDILQAARCNLERETSELLTLSSSLDLVERYMVWVCPSHLNKAKSEGIMPRLDVVPVEQRGALSKRLTNLTEKDDNLRSVLDDIIGQINSHTIQNRISMGLQVNRLRNLRFWGVIILFVFFALSPLATNLANVHDWPSQSVADLVKLPAWVNVLFPWLNALAMMILGAVGGFLSGLLQAQSTSITFTKYLENMLKLQLRPLVGALVSLVLYTLLSWQVLPGIKIENVGSYFLIAFLSGFSERYFLQLVKTDPESSSVQINVKERPGNLIGPSAKP